MDHHCPWIGPFLPFFINIQRFSFIYLFLLFLITGQCVGLHNVRHFTLFLVQLWLGCTYCLYITAPLLFTAFENEAGMFSIFFLVQIFNFLTMTKKNSLRN